MSLFGEDSLYLYRWERLVEDPERLAKVLCPTKLLQRKTSPTKVDELSPQSTNKLQKKILWKTSFFWTPLWIPYHATDPGWSKRKLYSFSSPRMTVILSSTMVSPIVLLSCPSKRNASHESTPNWLFLIFLFAAKHTHATDKDLCWIIFTVRLSYTTVYLLFSYFRSQRDI